MLNCSASCVEPPSDPCDGVVCQNDGNCVNGSCVCTDGYTGNTCQIPPDLCNPNLCLNGKSSCNSPTPNFDNQSENLLMPNLRPFGFTFCPISFIFFLLQICCFFFLLE